MASKNVVDGTDANFNTEVIKSSIPVLVDFWAPWCGPCKTIGPTLDALADEYVGKVKIVKVNVDENSDTPNQYGVRSIPSLKFFKDGKMVEERVGVIPKSQLEEMFTKHI
jgi:thioredoxin 1